MVEEALRDPLSVAMLNIDGKKLMEITGEKPGPRIGFTLHALLEEVLDDPSRNNTDYLHEKARELSALSDEKLREIGKRGKQKREEAEEDELKKIRDKYWVK